MFCKVNEMNIFVPTVTKDLKTKSIGYNNGKTSLKEIYMSDSKNPNELKEVTASNEITAYVNRPPFYSISMYFSTYFRRG